VTGSVCRGIREVAKMPCDEISAPRKRSGMLRIDELLVFDVEGTADWRRHKIASEHPNDAERNLAAADLLTRLASELRALEGSALHRRVEALLTRVDAPESFSKIISEWTKAVGFRSLPESADKFLEELIDALEYEIALFKDSSEARDQLSGLQSTSALSWNPFASPDLMNERQKIRQAMRDLMHQLKAENTQELEFQRQDLASLMRQMLTILGEDGDVPQKALRAVPEAGHELSLSLSNAEQISSRLSKLFENAASIYDRILSLWHHIF
jgi:hypothetical protein